MQEFPSRSLLCRYILCFLLALCMSISFLSGSVDNGYCRDAGDISYYFSGDFKRCRIPSSGANIYLSLQGARTPQFLLRSLKATFASKGFFLSKTPSQADLIVQVTIAFEGKASELDIRGAVAHGYDGKVAVYGRKIYGLVADVLLVSREIPEAKDDTQLKLKNISQRLALVSSTIRIGFASKNTKEDMPSLSKNFSDIFAKTILHKVMDATRR